MSDVFISYAHSTARQARAAAEALRALGYSVWLDEDLPAHRSFRPEIEQQLTAAMAALVIWSVEAATSDWVLSEASRAREARKLVQARVDRVRLPMPFDQIQCADLTGWSGDGNHRGWSKVAASLADLVKDQAQTRIEPPAAPALSSEPLLAVLAFDNLSGDPEMAYFSDGVSEEILQTVARGSDLKVIGRASSFLFRGADKRAARVAAELKATHILDGSVRRAGSKVRIVANLIECAHETTVWSERYDRDFTDIFALEDEIAASVAAALKTTFARSPLPPPIDPAVYDLFRRAQASFGIGPEATHRQLRMFEEVVARAPAFARGWAMLAYLGAYALRLRRDEAVAAGVTREQVGEAAETALRLDPRMGLAYQALGYLQPSAAYREQEALNEQALAAAPRDASVLGNMGVFCATVGRVREGLSFARRAHELDPLEPTVNFQLGMLLTIAGRYEESWRLTDAAYARWPESDPLTMSRLISAARRGDKAKVQRLTDIVLTASPESVPWRDTIWQAHNLLKPDPESLRAWLETQRRELERTGTMPVYAPWRLHQAGLAEEAFELIDKATFAHLFALEGPAPSDLAGSRGHIFGRHNEAMIRDPRVMRFLAKIGLVNYWIEGGKWPDCADEVPYDFRAEARKATGLD